MIFVGPVSPGLGRLRPNRVSVALIGSLIALLTAPAQTQALVLSVTTTEDVVADDGLCSLREAISSVNDASASGVSAGECPAGEGDDTIRLEADVYRITLEPAGEDANAGGDFDIARSVTIEGQISKTSVRNALGSRSVAGDGDRLFHIDPAAEGDVDVVFRGVSLEDGDAFCSGELCATGGAAIEAVNGRALTLEDCAVSNNSSYCSGEDCGRSSSPSAAGVVHGAGGDLTILRSSFVRNVVGCDGLGCCTAQVAIAKVDPDALGSVAAAITDGEIRNNQASCASSFCLVQDLVSLDAGSISITGLDLIKNTSSCTGADCSTGPFLDLEALDHQISATTVSGNRHDCSGDACAVDSTMRIRSGTLSIAGLVLQSDNASCEGADCQVEELLDSVTDQAAISGLVVKSTRGKCVGDSCDVDERVYLYAPGTLTVDDSTVSRNRAQCRGDGCIANAAFFMRADQVALTNSVLDSNKIFCQGQTCSITPATAFVSSGDTTESFVESVNIERNNCRCRADVCTSLAPACGLFAVADGGAAMRMTGVLISRNKGGAVGGGLGSLATLSLQSSEVSRNRSSRGGGGIFNGGRLSMTGSTIFRNNARAGRSIFIDLATEVDVCGGVVGCGGGILNQSIIESISDTILSENRPDDCFDDTGASGCP